MLEMRQQSIRPPRRCAWVFASHTVVYTEYISCKQLCLCCRLKPFGHGWWVRWKFRGYTPTSTVTGAWISARFDTLHHATHVIYNERYYTINPLEGILYSQRNMAKIIGVRFWSLGGVRPPEQPNHCVCSNGQHRVVGLSLTGSSLVEEGRSSWTDVSNLTINITNIPCQHH